MKTFTVMICLICTFNTLGQWNQQYSSTGNRLFDVQFLNTLYGFAAGDYNPNSIIRTTNGGENWQIQIINTSSYLHDLYFINTQTGYAVGNIIIKTTNSGDNWALMLTSGSSILGVHFPDSMTGYAVGGYFSSQFGWKGTLFKTSNGGISWSYTLIMSTNDEFFDLFFINSTTGFLMSPNGIIYKTVNGGQSMTNQAVVGNLHSIFFINENTGFTAGSYLYKTTNGGGNWLNLGNGGSSVFFINPNTGFICGNEGVIRKSVNGGINWYDINSGTMDNFESIFFADTNIGYVVGGGGAIFKTTNGGGIVGVQPVNTMVPENFHLFQNYPNPFNPQTKIKFELPSLSQSKSSIPVQLIIYDLLGREVAILVNEELKPGTYEADWDASNFSSGVYFYKIIAGDFIETRKMVLMK